MATNAGANGVGAAPAAVGGPQLVAGGGEAALIEALNSWGRTVDASQGLMTTAFSTLRDEVVGTQSALLGTIQEAKVALGGMHEGFRMALETQGAGQRAATEALVSDARAKFLALETKLAETTAQLEQWALGEGARTAQQIAGAAVRLGGSPLGTPAGTPPGSPRARRAEDPLTAADPWSNGGSFGPAPRARTGGASFQAYPSSAAAAATVAAPPPQAAPLNPAMPGREFRIEPRGWTSKALEPGISPEAFQIWRERALCFLSQGRQDIRRMLQWAEGQTAAEVEHGAATHALGFGMHDYTRVDFILHGAVMHIIGDSLLGRARCCEDHGILLWRTLCAEWAGSAPQYRHAKARRFQDPPRAKDVAALWAALPAWERLGEEVRSSGFDAPEWVRAAALEKMLPAELLRVLVSRPELDSYAAKLSWVKTQMEHARGSAQAMALVERGSKDTSGDVFMGALSGDPATQEPDSLAERLLEALNALGKGGGKVP